MFLFRAYGDIESLSQTIRACTPVPGSFALIRHSIRKRIWRASIDAAMRAPLTDAGRGLARRFGSLLSMPISAASSPVERCRETAHCIQEGHGSNGIVETWDVLGVPFFDRPLDERRFTKQHKREALRLFLRMDKWRIMREWRDGSVSPEIMAPYRECMRSLIGSLREKAAHLGTGAFPLFITHDITLAAVVFTFFQDSRQLPWPPYLAGAVITPSGTGLIMHYCGRTARLPDEFLAADIAADRLLPLAAL